jgi:hypothetical protein
MLRGDLCDAMHVFSLLIIGVATCAAISGIGYGLMLWACEDSESGEALVLGLGFTLFAPSIFAWFIVRWRQCRRLSDKTP